LSYIELDRVPVSGDGYRSSGHWQPCCCYLVTYYNITWV